MAEQHDRKEQLVTADPVKGRNLQRKEAAMTTLYRRMRTRSTEAGDNVIGYLTLLILGWLWVPALVELLIGG